MAKAYYSFDVLLSSLIVVFMLLYFINILQLVRYDLYIKEYNAKMEKLFIASQFFVYQQSYETYKNNPNIIEEISEEKVNSIREQLGLKELYIGYYQGNGNCIVRYVYNKETERVEKLFICGR